MKLLAINGSPRRKGNTSHLLAALLSGAQQRGIITEQIFADDLNLEFCQGCLRCNLIKKCANSKDDWPDLSDKILQAEVLVFATPVYFHHMSAQLKKMIDRFRCFVQVKISESGLIHTPWHSWDKQLILMATLGNSRADDAKPIEDLFVFINRIVANKKPLQVIVGTRLAVANQVKMTEDELKNLYGKINLSEDLAGRDFDVNQK